MDFAECTQIDDYRSIVHTELSKLDVGILVLNAGIAKISSFRDLKNTEVQALLSVNAIHPIFMMKCMMDQLISRKCKSAIMLTGSGIRAIPAPGMNLYSASKHFLMFIAQSVGYELNYISANIDMLCYEPGGVKTNMTD